VIYRSKGLGGAGQKKDDMMSTSAKVVLIMGTHAILAMKRDIVFQYLHLQD